MVRKSGLDKAIELTIDIAAALPNKHDRTTYNKIVQNIFDDQLQKLTTLNRNQRHNARKLLKEAMRNHAKK